MSKRIFILKCFLLLSISVFAEEVNPPTSKRMQKNRLTSIERSCKPIIILQVPHSKNSLESKNQEEKEGEDFFTDDYQFMISYYKTIESSLNRNERTGKLGKNTIKGKKSGTFSYSCKLNGWNKVMITMIYNDYCDDDFIINGTTIVEVNWMASGKMSGIIYADGPCKAIVEYHLVINESVESGGHYLLCRPENDYIVQVPASTILEIANRSIVLDENCKAPAKH